MDKIIGTNLGNWLVLEKWMQPFIFQGSDAEDETWLNRNVSKEELWPKMKKYCCTWFEYSPYPGAVFYFRR